MSHKIHLNIKTPMSAEAQERLEDALFELLSDHGLEGSIDNLTTGGTLIFGRGTKRWIDSFNRDGAGYMMIVDAADVEKHLLRRKAPAPSDTKGA